jgi:hypothetical protein
MAQAGIHKEGDFDGNALPTNPASPSLWWQLFPELIKHGHVASVPEPVTRLLQSLLKEAELLPAMVP